MMQSLLYPNETRVEKVFNQLWFKPYMSLFGEMFKPGKISIRMRVSLVKCESFSLFFQKRRHMHLIRLILVNHLGL